MLTQQYYVVDFIKGKKHLNYLKKKKNFLPILDFMRLSHNVCQKGQRIMVIKKVIEAKNAWELIKKEVFCDKVASNFIRERNKKVLKNWLNVIFKHVLLSISDFFRTVIFYMDFCALINVILLHLSENYVSKGHSSY